MRFIHGPRQPICIQTPAAAHPAIAFLFLAALLLILIVDGLRPHPPNPAERHSGFIVDEATDAILRRACFDCHSNETRWPWFTRLPGVAILARWDVLEGRDELNFSHWDRIGPRKKAKALRESLESIDEGEMPPWFYIMVHPDAALDRQDLILLSRAGGKYGLMAGVGEKNGRDGHDDDDDEEKKGRGKKDDD